MHTLVRGIYCIAVGPPPWPAFFATSHHSLDREAFYTQSHLITKNSVDFFTKFVSTGYKWPEGLDTLYLCGRSCHAKIRQGIARAADLTKLVNDLWGQFNQFTSTLTEIEIRAATTEVPGAVTPPSYKIHLTKPKVTKMVSICRRAIFRYPLAGI